MHCVTIYFKTYLHLSRIDKSLTKRVSYIAKGKKCYKRLSDELKNDKLKTWQHVFPFKTIYVLLAEHEEIQQHVMLLWTRHISAHWRASGHQRGSSHMYTLLTLLKLAQDPVGTNPYLFYRLFLASAFLRSW